ncbi:MAG: hypothetical protein ABR556_07945 [Pyrinomonadaceae bacterium]
MSNNSLRLLSPAYRLHLMLFVAVSLVSSMSLPSEINAQSLPQKEVFVASKTLSASRWNLSGEPRIESDAAGMTVAKHVPNNAVTTSYTERMAATDRMLAAIFGGRGAVAAANSFEPERLGHQYPLYRGDIVASDGRILRGHLSYAMHLYGSEDGTAETEIYVPLGFTSHSNEPTPTDAVVTFYYPRIGNLKDVTVAVFHIADFALRDDGGRVRIGKIGGPGGSKASYKHSHVEFYRGDTGLPPLTARIKARIDPTTVFDSTFETALRVKAATPSRLPY